MCNGNICHFPSWTLTCCGNCDNKCHKLTALIDFCSSDSFISEDSVKQLGLEIQPPSRNISMALTTMNTSITGCCTITLTLGDNVYNGMRLSVLKDLCSDIILGHNFQKLHTSLTIDMGETKPDLIISNTSPCALFTSTIDNISLFTNLLPECKPIATKSRGFSFDEEDFILGEIDRLLSGGIIEPSTSTWRAHIVVAKNGTQSAKKRLCVDYSQTINLYIELDAYPLPRIDTMTNKLAQYRVFSTYDLKNAYHQIPISQAERKYTAFEAGGQLYQFCSIPFGSDQWCCGVSATYRQNHKGGAAERHIPLPRRHHCGGSNPRRTRL